MAAATGSCAKPEHWIFEGTGMKKGDASQAWSAGNTTATRRENRGPRSRRGRHRLAGRRAPAALDGDDLSRAERELRLQRRDDLLGAGAVARRPATCCRGRTGAVRTAPTNGCSGSPTISCAMQSPEPCLCNCERVARAPSPAVFGALAENRLGITRSLKCRIDFTRELPGEGAGQGGRGRTRYPFSLLLIASMRLRPL